MDSRRRSVYAIAARLMLFFVLIIKINLEQILAFSLVQSRFLKVALSL